MSQTEGRWTAKTSFPDLQQFIGADEFIDLAGVATFNPVAAPATQLGAAAAYALLANSGITNTGNTVVSLGNVGSSPTATVTGFPSGVVSFPSTINNPGAATAQTALAAAIAYYQGLVPSALTLTAAATAVAGTTTYTGTITGGAANALVGSTLAITGFVNAGNNATGLVTASTAATVTIINAGGVAETHAGSASFQALSNLSTSGNGSTVATYLPGRYFSVAASSLTMPTGIILDAQGNANAQFVFVAGSTINLASGQSVSLINGAQAANVVFVAGSSYTSVATSTMNGNILAAVSATLGGGIQNGRVLANTGAITISAATVITVPALSTATTGQLYSTIGSGLTSNFVKTLSELLLRSGVYGSSVYDQEQFGTAAGQSGPTTATGTSGPFDATVSGSPNYQGFPPFPRANLATLTGGVPGPLAKGIQIDSVDIIYQVLTDPTSVAATVSLTKTNFANLVAPVITNLITPGVNGLPVVVGAQVQVTNVPVAAPAMIVAADTQVILNLNLTAGLAGTIKFYGAVIKAHYNFA